MAFDNYRTSTGPAGAFGNTVSWSHTVDAGSSGLLLVGVMAAQGSTPIPNSTVTYNSVSMGNPVARQYWGSGDGNVIELFGLVAPTVGGPYTVAVTASGGVSSVGGVGVSFTGAHQTVTFGTPGGAAVTTGALEIAGIGSAADELVVDIAACLWASPGVLSPDASQTERAQTYWSNNTDGDAARRRVGMSTKPGAASVTMTWSGQNTDGSGILAISVKPAAASSVTWLRHRA